MHPPLSEEQQGLVERVRALGRDRFAARASRYDAEASFPFENYADLREAGLLALTVPKRHGGLGADYATYAVVSAELGRWCGATALTFNMHACSMLWSSQIADDLPMPAEERALHERRRARFYERVVADGAIFAQPFSEPDSSPPPQTMCASGKYARVTQIPAKASQVPYLTRPAIEPLIRATVMMANVTWNATSMTLA